jgi:hypothetical protein
VDPNAILSKTAKGREEIETRNYKLDQRVRSVLIPINGKQTAAEVMALFSRFGDIAAILDQLLRDGFLQQQSGDPVAALKQARAEIARAISAALGPDGDAIAMKIEGMKSLAELRGYLETRRAMIDGALKDKAAAFWEKTNGLLAP